MPRNLRLPPCRSDADHAALPVERCYAPPHSERERRQHRRRDRQKGAFTDARHDKDGLFVAANGGTLFLDEVGELSLEIQAKLLRALQENRVRPVGAHEEVPFDARVLAATNRDLEEAVESGRLLLEEILSEQDGSPTTTS